MPASLLSLLLFPQAAAGPAPATLDRSLHAAIVQFYAAQEAEDVPAYMALWSAKGERPQLISLKTVFDAVDDRFTDLTVVRVLPSPASVRVDINVTRHRSMPNRTAGRPPILLTEVVRSALTYVMEDGEWKLLREGSPADALAAAMLDAAGASARDRLLEAEPDLLDVPLLTALSRRANGPARTGRYAEAQAIYEIVLDLARRIGAQKEEGEALQNIANALYFQRRFPDALAAYEARLAHERGRGADEAAAAALVGIATIRYSYAEYTEALARYRQALAIQERVDDVMGTATTLISTGNVRYLQGDFEGAVIDYGRSLELQRRMSHKDGEARALEGLGRTYAAQGNYGAALDAFAGVLEEGRARGDLPRQGFATKSIAEVHFRLGNLELARANYEESRGHYEAARDPGNLGRVWQGLGLTELVAADFAAAERAYRRGIDACLAAADRACAAHGITALAFAQSAQDKFQEAIGSYRKAIAEFTALEQREDAARAQIGLSQALNTEGEHAAAIDAARSARRVAVSAGNDDVLWRALTAEAQALRKSQAREGGETALGVARAAVSAIERMEADALAKPATSVPKDATAGLATFAVLQAESGDAAGAFATAERLRALDLRATLATNEREIWRGMSPEERQNERAEAMHLTSLHAQLAREKELPKPDRARIARLEARVAEATALRNETMARLFEKLPDLRVWRGLAPAAAAAVIASVLDAPDTILVQFVVDEHDLLTIAASRDGEGIEFAAHLTPIGRRELARHVAGLLQGTALRDPEEWRKAAEPFTALIPAPVMAQLLASRRAIVIPHEMLWRVPFEALPVPGGTLIDRVDIVYAASIEGLRRGTPGEDRPADALLAAGGPDLSESARARMKSTAPGWTLRSAEAASGEAAQVAAAHEVAGTPMILAGSAATEPAWRAQASSARVLHVAAPFRINGASPLFSPILMAGDPLSKEASNDGAVEAREIANMDLRASVAVLSDGAALSMRDGATALDAIHWTWLAAGVPALLVARWPADAGEELVSVFHRYLHEGAPPGDALRRARETIRGRPEAAAPLHWAGWMLMTGRQ